MKEWRDTVVAVVVVFQRKQQLGLDLFVSSERHRGCQDFLVKTRPRSRKEEQ